MKLHKKILSIFFWLCIIPNVICGIVFNYAWNWAAAGFILGMWIVALQYN